MRIRKMLNLFAVLCILLTSLMTGCDPEATSTPGASTTPVPSPTGHSHAMAYKWTVKPSCTNEGYDYYSCVYCDYTELRNYVEAYGHNWEDLQCTRCGQPGDGYGRTYEVLEDGTCMMTYYGYHDAIVGGDVMMIPESIDGYSVSSIGENAFKYKYVNSLIIPDNVKRIEDNAFFSATVNEVTYLSKNIEYIGEGAFYDCNFYGLVLMPAELVEIGDHAFFEAKIDKLVLNEKLRIIGNKAFAGNDIVDIYIPATLEVWDNAFVGCAALKNIVFEYGLKSIATGAFIGCKSISEIRLPVTLTAVGDFAFSNCTSLSKLRLPSVLTSIGEYAFSNTALESVTLPEGIKSIGEHAFSSCKSLDVINYEGTVDQWKKVVKGNSWVKEGIAVVCSDGIVEALTGNVVE